MKHSAGIATTILAVVSFSPAFAQTWCGKNYMSNQTVVPPGGQFQLPASSADPLVTFRCAPAFRPYLEEDATSAAFIVDTPIVYQYIQGASPISLPSCNTESNSSNFGHLGTLDVTINIDNQVFARRDIPLNTTGYEIHIDISSLVAQKTQYNVTCNGTHQVETGVSSSQTFSARSSLLYLPDTSASVVKTDLRTSALWVRPADGTGGDFQPFIPQGFYVSFDQQLAHNLSLIDLLKADGFNTIHAIPPYDNVTLFEQVVNKTVELGLYFVYDLRSSYQNLTAVAQLVSAYSSLPNLLLWETAHEPDGKSDPFDAARDVYDLIYGMDGYHPVSIVLNCQDYNFVPYVEGADIVLEDAYPVGINATYSPIWHTPCTADFGHCGCDNCEGFIYDIKARIQTFKDRLSILGYDRTKTVWTTPQALGSGAYWNTTPTGQQWAAMGLTSFNHGARGSMSFQFPPTTSPTIESMAVNLTRIIGQTIQPFLVDPKVSYGGFTLGAVDAGLWYNGTTYLLLVANLGQSEVDVPWDAVGLGAVTGASRQVQQILSVDQDIGENGLRVWPGGIGVYMATPPGCE